MGGCNSSGRSRAFTLDELQDLPIGQRKEMGKGCGPNIEGTQGGSCVDRLRQRGFGYPSNGEFDWGGTGSACSMCSCAVNGYGCDNCSGSQAIGGRRGTVKRIAYTGDIKECCKTQTHLLNGKTCDPRYIRGYQDDACDSHMATYCTGDKLATSECQKWINASLENGRTIPNVPLKEYCSVGKNFNTQTCQRWCDKTKNIPSMAGECDQVSQIYCKTNPNDDLCKCMNPPANVTKAEALVASAKVCWYRACKDLANDNYITSTMRDQKKNCVSTVCSIDVGDIQISGANNAIDFKNECASNILKPEAKEAIEQEKQKLKDKDSANKAVEEKEEEKKRESNGLNTNVIYQIILLIMGILCLIGSIFLFKKSTIGGVSVLVSGVILLVITSYMFIVNSNVDEKTVTSD